MAKQDRVCGRDAYEVVVDPQGLTRLTVQIRCGEVLKGEVLYPCALVESKHLRDTEVEYKQALGSEPGCEDIPEPGFVVMLAAGTLLLACLRVGATRPRAFASSRRPGSHRTPAPASRTRACSDSPLTTERSAFRSPRESPQFLPPLPDPSSSPSYCIRILTGPVALLTSSRNSSIASLGPCAAP